jgi:hypothetical protein
MPIGPVSPKDMGRAGRGTSSKGSVTGKGVSKAKPKAKGPTAAEVKALRQSRIDDALEMQEVRYTGFSPLKSRLPNFRGVGGNRFAPSVKRGTGTSVSRGTKNVASAKASKEAVKSGASKDYALPKKVFGATNSARQKPVPTKPSKTGPQTRKLVKKGK